MDQSSTSLNKSRAPCESPPSPKTTLGTNLDISRELAKTRAAISNIEQKVVEMQLVLENREDNDSKRRAVSDKSSLELPDKR